jgi:hypothetical protein
VSEHWLLILDTIFGGVGALADIGIVILMVREMSKPASDRRIWPWLIAMALIAVPSLPTGYLAYKLASGTLMVFPVSAGLPAPPKPTTSELPKDSSRIDVVRWYEGVTDKKQFFVNVIITNEGNSPTDKFIEHGMIAISPRPIPKDVVEGFFSMLKTQIALGGMGPERQIYPKQQPIFFTLFGNALDEATLKEIRDGIEHPYVFSIMKYSDRTTPPGKYIYTETCIYFVQKTIHLCENGHNRSYIAN